MFTIMPKLHGLGGNSTWAIKSVYKKIKYPCIFELNANIKTDNFFL